MNGEVFVVDDDATMLGAIGFIMRREGWSTRTFGAPDALLRATADSAPACVLIEVVMPQRSGLDLLADLKSRALASPIVMMSGAGDIPMAVEAIRRGAVDFLRKPFSREDVIAAVNGAVKVWREREEHARMPFRADFPGHALLTPREHDILERIASGATAKEAAIALAISPRTVEFHRARILEKLGAKNSADLMRIVMRDLH